MKVSFLTRKFLRGMGIYALVVLLLAGLGLGLFTLLLRDYENTRPAHVAEQWLQSKGGEYPPETQLLPLPRLQDGEEQSYALVYEDRHLATLVLREAGKSRFGFLQWQVEACRPADAAE